MLCRCANCHEWLDVKYALSWNKEIPDVPHGWFFCTEKCMERFTEKWKNWHNQDIGESNGTSVPPSKQEDL